MEGIIMRKLIIGIIGLAVLFGAPLVLSGCGPAESSAAAKAPASHAGTWKADGFEATVTASDITINIVGDDDSKSLYWKGTFHEGNDVVKSHADREALDASMLGSQDSDKNFAVDDDQIAFEMSMMGTTKTIKLKKA